MSKLLLLLGATAILLGLSLGENPQTPHNSRRTYHDELPDIAHYDANNGLWRDRPVQPPNHKPALDHSSNSRHSSPLLHLQVSTDDIHIRKLTDYPQHNTLNFDEKEVRISDNPPKAPETVHPVHPPVAPDKDTPTVPIGDTDVKIPEDKDRSTTDKIKDKMSDAKRKVEDTAKTARDKTVETTDSLKEKVKFRWGQFKRGLGKIRDRLKAPFVRD
jgi:hypothetical protein